MILGSTTGSGSTAVLVANRAYGIASSRLPLIDHLIRRQWRVIVAASKDHSIEKILDTGAEFVPITFSRSGVNPLGDVATFRSLWVLYQNTRPTLIHHFNAKPVILGTLASRAAGRTRVVNTITGIGNALEAGSLASRWAKSGFRWSARFADATIFQNPDDEKLFVRLGLVAGERSHTILSSGVATTRFTPAEDGDYDTTVRVLLVSRLLWQKGIAEFVEVAKRVRQTHDVQFVLGGELDSDHPDRVPLEWIREQVRAGAISFMGYINDMVDSLRSADVFVFPSRYREGVPRVVLEAASAGLPVVTSDAPGCREVVIDQVTGFLVDPSNLDLLEDRVRRLVLDPKLRLRMGSKGRELMCERFDIRRVLEQTLCVYHRVGVKV